MALAGTARGASRVLHHRRLCDVVEVVVVVVRRDATPGLLSLLARFT